MLHFNYFGHSWGEWKCSRSHYFHVLCVWCKYLVMTASWADIFDINFDEFISSIEYNAGGTDCKPRWFFFHSSIFLNKYTGQYIVIIGKVNAAIIFKLSYICKDDKISIKNWLLSTLESVWNARAISKVILMWNEKIHVRVCWPC